MKKNSILEARRACISKETQATIDFSFEIVDKIHHILESKGMSQKDLAVLLGKNESEISKWMRGTHNFTISTIIKIEHALDCKILSIQKDLCISTIISTSPIVLDIHRTTGTILSGNSRITRYGHLSSPYLRKSIKLN